MTKEEIHNICSEYKITNYTINDELSIDVDGNVNLRYMNLRNFHLKFRNVTGNFNCSYANLTSLEGAPSFIGGKFICHHNPLESLKGITLNLSEDNLFLSKHFTYSGYLIYCRDLKFKKLLK